MDGRRSLLVGSLALILLCLVPTTGWAVQDYLDMDGTWLPTNINSAWGAGVDFLYYLIFWTVAGMFILTEVLLVVFCVRYRAREGGKANYSHGNNKAEIIWTVIPAVMLFSLALLQQNTWAKARMNIPDGAEVVKIQVMPKQYEWGFRYAGRDGRFGPGPGKDGKIGTDDDTDPDDVLSGNLHIPVDKAVVLLMSSKDVIHSIYLPHARLKQDVVPGFLTRAWFIADRTAVWDRKANKAIFLKPDAFKGKKIIFDPGIDSFIGALGKKKSMTGERDFEYTVIGDPKQIPMLVDGKLVGRPAAKRDEDGEISSRPRWEGGVDPEEAGYILYPIDIACAELCGMGHYKMRSQLFVHTDESFQAWYELEMLKVEYNDDWEGKRWDLWDQYHPDFNK